MTRIRSRRWMQLGYGRRLFLLGLLAGLPAVAAGLVALWMWNASLAFRIAGSAAAVLLWIGMARLIRDEIVRPLQTLSNLVAAVRIGDLSAQPRVPGGEDPLSLALRELRLLEERLREQRIGAVEATALLRRVLEEIDVAVFGFGEDRVLKLVNRAGERLLNRPTGELIGRSAGELGLTEALDGPAPRTLELGGVGAGGGRWELRRTVVRQEGLPVVLLVLSDLSRALREEERQAWKRLIRVLGHEINNSLTPIKSITGSLRALLDGRSRAPDFEDDLDRGLRVVESRSEALSRFMASYARLARLPAPEPVEVEVEELVRRVVALETRVDVAVRPGPPATVRADRDQLEQLLINLIHNAAEAAVETGGGAEVTWRARGDRLEIQVEDEGPGLPDPGNLFVPFFTTKEGGSGIGLALSREIAEGHGGRLSLANREEGRGARALLELPIALGPAVSAPNEPRGGS